MRAKARLTITLPTDLLDEVDRLIDKRTVRNRSHAIELLLRKSLSPTVSTAVLLAGGKGEEEYPPALLPIQGQALIIHIMNHLQANGIRRFIILAGQNEEMISELVGNMGAEIHFISEREPMGTAGALKAAQSIISDRPFLILHADILTDIDVADFIKFHSEQNRLATIAVKPRQTGPYYGKVMLKGSEITEFIPKGGGEGIGIVNTGVYLFEPQVLGLIREGTNTKLETDIFPKLANLGELSAYLFQGIWFDISRSQSYESAQQRWQQRR
jgi:NDP-sugar pyrophosphorylase family protein